MAVIIIVVVVNYWNNWKYRIHGVTQKSLLNLMKHDIIFMWEQRIEANPITRQIYLDRMDYSSIRSYFSIISRTLISCIETSK